MGSELLKGVAPFKIEGAWSGDFHNDLDSAPDPIRKLLMAGEDQKAVGICGWSYDPNEDSDETFGDLYATPIRKGNKVVFEINEDEYAAGGGVSESFFARTREELEEFCKDWGFDASQIKANAATVQVL